MTNRTADHGRIQFDCKAFLAHPGNGKKSHEVGPPPGWANLAAPWIRQESGNLSPQMSADETQIKTFNHKRHKETQSRSGDPVMARDRERAMPCRGFSRMSADQDGNYGIHPHTSCQRNCKQEGPKTKLKNHEIIRDGKERI